MLTFGTNSFLAGLSCFPRWRKSLSEAGGATTACALALGWTLATCIGEIPELVWHSLTGCARPTGSVKLTSRHSTALNSSNRNAAAVSPPLRVDKMVDEAELFDHRGREDERVNVGLAHAAVKAVEREGQRQPHVDELLSVANLVGVEVDRRLELTAMVELRIDADPERSRHLQGVDDVEIM